MVIKLAWGCMFHGDDFIGGPTFFIHLSIPPCGGEGFDDQMIIVGNAQDTVLGFIKHRIYIFTQDDRYIGNKWCW